MTQKAEKDTAAYKVFKWPWQVWIPSAFSMSRSEMEEFGTITTGNSRYDSDMANESVPTMATISRLAKLNSEGCQITLMNPRQDSAKMYAIITEFLDDWAKDINSGLTIERESEEFYARMEAVRNDIEMIEALSAVLFPVAQRTTPATGTSAIQRALSSLSRRKLEFVTTNTQTGKTVTEHHKFSDSLTDKSQDRIRRWMYRGNDE